MHLNGKNRKMSFNGRKLAGNEQMDRRFMFMKIFWAQRVVCPCPRAIYRYMTNGRKLARNEQMDRRFMFLKIFWAGPRGLSAPAPWLYTGI